MDIAIDLDRCMGAGDCVDTAPATFSLGDDGQSTVSDAAASRLDLLVAAARHCPSSAISLYLDGLRVDVDAGARES